MSDLDYYAEHGKMLLTLIPEWSAPAQYTCTANHWRKCWGDHETAGPAIERALTGVPTTFETPSGSNLIRLAKLDDLKDLPLRGFVTALLSEDDAVADAAAEVIRRQGWDVAHCYALACRG